MTDLSVIGIIGGIGSGKSFVSAYLNKEHGCGLIDADKIAHEVLNLPEIIDQMVCRWRKRFGSIYDPRKLKPVLDRSLVAKIVFKDRDELAFLEAIMHPIMSAELSKRLSRYHPKYTPAVILDAPLLLEAKWDVFCTQIWFIATPLDKRLRNAASRGGAGGAKLDKIQFEAREARQISVEEKRGRANLVIPNYGTQKELVTAVDAAWKKFTQPGEFT